jgi:hypothetical protein
MMRVIAALRHCPGQISAAESHHGRMADLPWQSANKRSLETVMFRNINGLLEMAVCCAKPPYYAPVLTKPHPAIASSVNHIKKSPRFRNPLL